MAIKDCVDTTLSASMRGTTVQDYLRGADRRFDVVMMANSINHLDEQSCIRLAEDPSARAAYLSLLKEVYAALAPGGYLVITDCSRSNFFNDIGLKSPLMKTIEWEKHQNPHTWDALLQEAGFEKGVIQWSAPNSLGEAGRAVLGHRAAAYFLLSHFRLVNRKPSQQQATY
jgi:SAM-dependent methyltransferase